MEAKSRMVRMEASQDQELEIGVEMINIIVQSNYRNNKFLDLNK